MFRISLLASVAVFGLNLSPGAALAQSTDVQAQRAAFFQQMLSDPANRTLMRDYARLSVQMRDFEAAAATLERLLDLEPENSAARVELAIAYFALGSYAVAEYHLALLTDAGGLSPDQAARVARYREEARDRDDGSEISGRVELGYASTTEADADGGFINAFVDWRFDLGGPNVTQWVTEMALTSFQVGDDSFSDRQTGRIRTGPEFRLAGDAYGPRLQPYVQVDWFEDADFLNGDFTEITVGLAYQNPLNERFTVYADARYGRAYPDDEFQADQEVYEASLGATYRPSRDTRFRLSATVGERRDIDTAFGLDYSSTAVRLSAQHSFDVDLPVLAAVPNDWVVRGFVELEDRDADGAFSDTDYEELSYGGSLRAFFYEDFYLEMSAAGLERDTTQFGFTTSDRETVYALQVGWEF